MAKHTGIGDRDDGLDVALSLLWQRHGTKGERVYGEKLASRLRTCRQCSRKAVRLAKRGDGIARAEVKAMRWHIREMVRDIRSLLLGK